jgi:RNA polymerase sigma-70 factor (ECF subfamily)
MGGMESKLPETRWSLILGARTQDQTRLRLCMENLANAYWKPIYCYLRRRGFDNEEAKDLTQDFFYGFILEGKLLQTADKELGCFRQLLSTALKRFVSNVKRDKSRQIRAPKGGVVPLSTDLSNIDIPASEATPEQAFKYAWVSNLLDQILAETKKQCYESGQQVHWQVFHRKVLAPILEDAKDISMKEISQIYGLEDANQANSRIVTVKRRFARILNRRLRDLGGSDVQAEAEFEEIMRFLSEKSARL